MKGKDCVCVCVRESCVVSASALGFSLIPRAPRPGFSPGVMSSEGV